MPPSTHVINPLTGRKIKRGGQTHQKLKRQGIRVRNLRNYKPLKAAKPRSLKKTIASTPPSRKAKIARAKKQLSRVGEKRGARTRGWAIAAPQKGKERRELYQRCGQSCFLGENQSFPICAALRETDTKGRFTRNPCRPDCRGITSAKSRARQYKYDRIAKRASRLEGRYKC